MKETNELQKNSNEEVDDFFAYLKQTQNELKKEEEEKALKVQKILKDHKRPFSRDVVRKQSAMLNSISDMFPEYEKDILALMGEAQYKFNMTLPKTPGVKGSIDFSPFSKSDNNEVDILFSDTQSKKVVAEHMVDIENMISKIKKDYSDPNKKGYSPEKLEFLEVVEKYVKFAQTDDFDRMRETEQMFFEANGASFVSMPTSLYLDKNQSEDKTSKDKKYVEDNVRFAKMLKEFPFLKQIKDRNNFVMDKYLPYIKKAEKSQIKAKEATDMKKEYKKFLKQQNEYFKKIKSITDKDKDVIETRTVDTAGFNTGIQMNWQNERFGDHIISQVKMEKKFLDLGWGVRDLAFLAQFKKSIEMIDKAANRPDDNTAYTDKQVADAKRIKNKYKDIINKFENTYISDNSVRKSILTEMKEPVNELNNFVKGMLNSEIKSLSLYKKFDVPGNTCIKNLYEKTVKTPVMDSEIGNNAVNKLSKNVNLLVEELKKVEISRLRKPSPQFGIIKDNLLDLQRYANNDFKKIKALGPENISAEMRKNFEEYKKKAVEVLKSVEGYLEHKSEQFDLDANRKTDATKQKREQPRIRTALHIYDTLTDMIEKIDKHQMKNAPKKEEDILEIKTNIEKDNSIIIENNQKSQKVQRQEYSNSKRGKLVNQKPKAKAKVM